MGVFLMTVPAFVRCLPAGAAEDGYYRVFHGKYGSRVAAEEAAERFRRTSRIADAFVARLPPAAASAAEVITDFAPAPPPGIVNPPPQEGPSTAPAGAVEFERNAEGAERVTVHLAPEALPSVRLPASGEKPQWTICVKGLSAWQGPAGIPADGNWIAAIHTRFDPHEKALYVVLNLKNLATCRIRQDFDPRANVLTLRATAAGGEASTEADAELDILATLAAWQAAWESKDLRRYMDLYHPDFRSDNRDRAAWRRHRQAVSAGCPRIRVELAELALRLEGTRALAFFRQSYQADTYRDSGFKTLELRKSGGSWKIFRERWFAERPRDWPS